MLLPSLLISVSLALSAPAPSRFDLVAHQAEAARAESRLPEAIRLYREATGLRPSWADGWWYLGSLLYDQDRFAEAAKAFQHLTVDPKYRGSAHAFLGLCEYETGRYDDALAQFRAWAGSGWAGTRELRDVGYYHFALLLTRNGEFIKSLALLTSITQQLGDTPEIAEAMGLASLRVTDLPENYPPELRERIWLAGKATLYAQQNPALFERADEYAARLEARYPHQPEIHAFRATLYGFEKKSADAEREYREELKISPNHVPSLVALVRIDLQRDDTVEGIVLARKATSIEPGNAEAHHLIGRILFADGDLAAAAQELEAAKQLAPTTPAVRAHLAMVYGKMGRIRESKAESDAYLALRKRVETPSPANMPPNDAPEKTR
ncbi:tetratricopeptide repeat protein [Acidobacteria bacterium AB60]|nr:tetratricopeptide repeat protein [Acidobacteria bacterium AB60]